MNGRTNASATMVDAIEIPLDPVTNFSATPGNGNIELIWTDPKNKYATDEGETAQDPDQLVSVWKYTKIVRKIGEYPQNPNDGVIVVESGVHNQYQTNPYVDTGLENDTTYYYCAYAINEDEVASEPAQVYATSIVGIMLSTLSEGTLIKINENGSPVEFYIAKHDYEPELNGTGRTLIIRKDAWEYEQWFKSGSNYASVSYAESNIPNKLISEYNIRFSSRVLTLIGNTSFYYGDGNYNSKLTMSAPTFLVTFHEINLPKSPTANRNTYSSVGKAFDPEITNLLIKCYYNGTMVPWAYRDNVPNYSENCYWGASVTKLGYSSFYNQNNTSYPITDNAYIRPIFTLPETSTVNNDMLFMENQ